jgi:peptide/nickel transport system substrate-binding protein
VLKFHNVAYSAAALAACLVAAPAIAQKSKDTLRIASTDHFAVLSPYDLPLDEASPIYDQVYRTFISFDEHQGKFVPEVVKSWKRINDTTLEFDLRDDITLHSGKNMTADDAKVSFEYPIDPKVRIRAKGRYKFVKKFEKLGRYKFRLHMGKPFPLDLISIAFRFYVLDSDVFKSLENKADYGRVSASSAGPYKMVSNDRNKGYVFKRFDGFKGNRSYHGAPAGTIKVIPIPDAQTQVAELLTGGIDVLRNLPKDLADNLGKGNKVKITATPSKQYTYLQLDKVGRSPNKAFTDLRVRKAAFMAIDRALIGREIVPGGDQVKVMESVCFRPGQVACDYTTNPYSYNPSEAKKLLAEAGYANGFDVTLVVHSPVKHIAVAIAGAWRKVGIRASIQPLPIGAYVKKRGQGLLTAFVGSRPNASLPDTTTMMQTFFLGARDYWKDQMILDAIKVAFSTRDNVARGAVLRPAIDRINTGAYILPLVTSPWVFAHSNDVKVSMSKLKLNRVTVSDISWK